MTHWARMLAVTDSVLTVLAKTANGLTVNDLKKELDERLKNNSNFDAYRRVTDAEVREAVIRLAGQRLATLAPDGSAVLATRGIKELKKYYSQHPVVEQFFGTKQVVKKTARPRVKKVSSKRARRKVHA